MVELRPRRSKATTAAESTAVQETPKPKVAKTPRSTKRKATEDESPAATKKQRSVKTPAKAKDVTDTPTEAPETSTTPAPKSAKKAKTPAKKKDAEEEKAPETPAAAEKATPKPKKEKTPAKAQETPKPAVADTPKPASKATPKTAPKETPKTASKATPKSAVESTPKETPKPASKAKATPKSAPKSAAKSTAKETPKSATKEADATPAPKPKAKQEKTPKKTPAKATPAKATPAKATPATATPAKSAKKGAKNAAPELVVEEQEKVIQEIEKEAQNDAAEEEEASSDEEVDEQTKALVQAVDSGDEDEQASGLITFEEGQDVGLIPDVSKALTKKEKKEKKALKAASSKQKEETGVIYIGRLPHGFYEHEMKNYFSQFGPIRNLRVSRNKKTGRAKHFAFVEFEDASTAEIVAKTMDNYLLFGHILKCSVIPKDQVHKDLFKGSNKRFKSIPWNKMQGKEMERPKLEKQWERSIKRENKKRAARAKKLEALGYEFNAPELKSVTEAKAIAGPEEPKAIEAPPATEPEADTAPVEAAPVEAAIEESPVEKAEAEVEAEAEAEATPVKKATRGRGRPAKTPQKAAATTETPRKTRRTKA